MSNKRSPLSLIFTTVFIDLIGFGIVIPVLPVYAERFGASAWVIGWLLGIYSGVQLLCAPLLGKLSDRIGRRPVLLVSLLGTSLGFLLMGAARSLSLLFVARIIDGATGGNISTALAYIADVTSPKERSRKMGIIGAAFGVGFILGPAIGGLLGHFSLAAPFYFAAALAFGNSIAVFFYLPESLPPEHRQKEKGSSFFQTLRSSERNFLLILTTYFLTTAAFSLLTATYPLFTERRFGYGVIENGYIFASQGLLSAFIQGGLLGWLIKHFREKRLVFLGTFLLAVNLFALPMGSTIPWLLAATAGLAVGHGLGFKVAEEEADKI